MIPKETPCRKTLAKAEDFFHNGIMKFWPLLVGCGILLLSGARSREWTATDGRKLEAEFVSTTEDSVIVKRAADGRTFTLPLKSLSKADQTWVKEELAKNVKPVEGPYAALLTGEWALSEDDGLPFALFGAKDLGASKRYPLVVALHERSPNAENGKQLGAVSKSFSEPARYEKNPCIIFAPLGYQPYGGQGIAWSKEPGIKSLATIQKLITSLPIDEDRVYVVGHAMGGMGSCQFAVKEPQRFAAVVAAAGNSGRNPVMVEIFNRVPLWLFHAADDPIFDVEYTRNVVDGLKRSDTFKYTEYRSGGHDIAERVFKDDEVHDWIFQQRRK